MTNLSLSFCIVWYCFSKSFNKLVICLSKFLSYTIQSFFHYFKWHLSSPKLINTGIREYNYCSRQLDIQYQDYRIYLNSIVLSSKPLGSIKKGPIQLPAKRASATVWILVNTFILIFLKQNLLQTYYNQTWTLLS